METCDIFSKLERDPELIECVESVYYSQMVSANSCSHVHLDDFDSEHYVCVDCGCLIARPRLHHEDDFFSHRPDSEG